MHRNISAPPPRCDYAFAAVLAAAAVRSVRVIGGAGVNMYAPLANVVWQREHRKTPLAVRETVTVEHFGQGALGRRARSMSRTLRRIRIP
jgi:hypothetical protein